MPFDNVVRRQNVDEINVAIQLPLGTKRYYAGMTYVYSQNTADAELAQGSVLVDDPCNADTDYSFDDVPTNTVAERGPGGSYAISQVIDVPLGSNSATKDAGFYAGMHLFVDDGLGEGQYARIQGNTAAVSGSAFKIYLQTALTTALTAASNSDVTVIPENIVKKSLASGASGSFLDRVVGIAPMTVTASYYFWRITDGVCPVLIGEAGTVLYGLKPNDDTAGQALAADTEDHVDEVIIFGEILVVAPAADTLCVARVKCR